MKRVILISMLIQVCMPFSGFCILEWKRIGPGLGSVERIVPDRNHPDISYVINDGELYRSTEYGRSWEKTGISGLARSHGFANRGVVVHPDTSEVYVSTYDGFWLSRDNGASFERRSKDSLDSIYSVHGDADLLYAIHRGTLRVSSDRGKHWQELSSGFPYRTGQVYPPDPSCKVAGFYFGSFGISPFDLRKQFLAGELGIDCGRDDYYDTSITLESSNGGRSWSFAKVNLEWFLTDLLHPERMFGFGDDGLYRLTPSGWTLLTNHLFRQLISVPAGPDTLIGIERQSVRISRDAGKNWKQIPISLPGFQTLQINDRGEWIAGTVSAGIYIRGNGNAWTSSNKGFQGSSVWQVFSPASWEVYAVIGGGSSPAFLYYSRNGGAKWKSLWSCSRCFARLSVHPAHPKRMSIHTENMLYFTEDGGQTWRQTSKPRGVHRVVFDPILANRVYGVGRDLYRSDDAGWTFHIISRAPVPIYRLVIDPRDNRRLFFLTDNNGVFKSEDGGKTTRAINNGLERCQSCTYLYMSDLTALAAPGQYLLIAGGDPTYITYDYGEHWQIYFRMGGVRLYLEDGSGQRLFLFTGYRLLHTTDGGRNWTGLTADVDAEIHDVSDPRLTPIFAATNRGVYTHVR